MLLYNYCDYMILYDPVFHIQTICFYPFLLHPIPFPIPSPGRGLPNGRTGDYRSSAGGTDFRGNTPHVVFESLFFATRDCTVQKRAREGLTSGTPHRP